FLFQFREYLFFSSPGTKNSRKQELALWYLVSMLVTGNQIKTTRSTSKA
uniref:Uncharacterized protein n=1 Tax=Triticum urartu TaxID=4572 RepID=A0A8R7TKA4_TRIUA